MNIIKRQLFSLSAVLILLTLCSCAGSARVNSARGEIPDEVSGIYYGLIPAADSPGISVVLILNKDGFYKMTYQYVDRDVPVLTSTGSYRFDAADDLVILDDEETPYYRLGKETLTQLDTNGRKITGALSRNYTFIKSPMPY